MISAISLENMYYILLEIFSVLAFHCEFDYFVDFGTSLHALIFPQMFGDTYFSLPTIEEVLDLAKSMACLCL